MIFEVRNGCFSYGDEEILNKINFRVESGDLLSILGPNGVGKTTLIRCMLGFLKWNDGVSLLDDKNIKKYKTKDLYSKISYVPQSRNVEKSSLSGMDYVLLGLASKINYFNLPQKDDYSKAIEIMESLSILDMKDKKMNEISGGQLQLFLIARALVSQPQFIILDEPESNLDFKNQIIVLDVLSQLAKNNIGVIFNTHYPSHALQRSNKSLLLSDNNHCLFGDTNSIITENNLVNAFNVETSINYIESDNKVYANVLPLKVLDSNTEKKLIIKNDSINTKLATISIIVTDEETILNLNKILINNSKYIIGKMSMFYEKKGVYIIVLALDGPMLEIELLHLKLSKIKDICVKVGFSNN